MDVMAFDVYNMAETGEVTKTLNARSSDADHVPVVCFAPDGSNCTGYKESEVSATLCLGYHYGGGGDAALILEDRKVISLEGNGARPSHQGSGVSQDGTMFTLNTIERHSVCYAIQGNMVDRNTRQDGSGISNDVCPTLNTQDKHAVCYGISPFASNAMLSSNPRSGIYEATTSRTLDLNGGNPTCNQGGVVVVVENKVPALVFKERAGKPGGGKGILIAEERMFTLSTFVIEAICYERKVLQENCSPNA